MNRSHSFKIISVFLLCAAMILCIAACESHKASQPFTEEKQVSLDYKPDPSAAAIQPAASDSAAAGAPAAPIQSPETTDATSPAPASSPSPESSSPSVPIGEKPSPAATGDAFTSSSSTPSATASPTPSEPYGPPAPGTVPVEPEPPTPVVIPEKTESSYERMLAAAAVMGLMLDAEDPDFTVDAIYFTRETPQERYLESKGIYVAFTNAAGTAWLFCAPLSAERTEPGTTDITTADLGWASFTYVNRPDLTGLIAVSMDDLSEEIGQSLLVTVSRH